VRRSNRVSIESFSGCDTPRTLVSPNVSEESAIGTGTGQTIYQIFNTSNWCQYVALSWQSHTPELSSLTKMLARHNEPSSSNPPRLTAARHIEASSPKCLLLSLLLLVMRRSARHMSRAAQIHLLGSPSSPNCLLTLRRSAQKCSLSRAVQNGPEHNEPSSPNPPLLLGTLRRAECFLSRAVQNASCSAYCCSAQ